MPRIAHAPSVAFLGHAQQGKEAEHLQTEIDEMELDRKQDQEDDMGVTPASSIRADTVTFKNLDGNQK